MIIWLASYPKSGNTWVRIFINYLLFFKEKENNINNIKIGQFPNKKHFTNIIDDFSDIKKILENSIHAQDLLNLDGNLKFFKTHSAYWKSNKSSFTNESNTLGVIHIVRDPRNIITSLKNHFSKDEYDELFNFMVNEKKFIGSKEADKEFEVATLISSWSNHYKSWKKIEKNYLLIKYENLLKNNNEFYKIVRFLEVNMKKKFSEEQVKKAIDYCKFENLKKQEDDLGFRESPNENNKKFFFLGPKNNWENIISKEIQKKIEDIFEKEMKELNYL